MQDLVVLGSGGHAKVVIELLREGQLYRPVACLGPAAGSVESVLGVPLIGTDNMLSTLRAEGLRFAFVALGDNRLRQQLTTQARELGFQLANAISRHATISSSVHLGQGVAIMAGANLGPETRLGDGVIVNTHASVDHDGQLADFCHLAPGVTLAGCVKVGARTFVGTGTSVIPQVTLGEDSVIGAGAVVVRDLPPGVVAYGIPARPQRAAASANWPDDSAEHSGDNRAEATPRPPLRLVS